MDKIPPFFLFVLLGAFTAVGQDYYFKHYNADDGLSRNTVITTLLSEKGFLWIGTKDGLNRFDGHNFKIFRKEIGEGNGLGSSVVESLHEHAGILWVGTGDGLYAYDEIKDRFILVNATSRGLIRDIEHDTDGNIWYVSDYTLFRRALDTGETFIYNSKKLSYIEDLTRDADGNLWAAFENKLFRYKKEVDDFETYEIGPAISGNIPLKISKLFSFDETTLLLGTENHGALSFEISTQKAKKLFSGEKGRLFVRDFLVKDKTDLWIATESGLYIHNLRTGDTKHLEKKIGNPYSLSDNAIYSITEDREGGIWIGSYFGGLDYYPRQRLPFKKYFPQPRSNSISGEAIREIRADDFGNLWIGSEDGGLNKMDLATGTFTNYYSDTDGDGIPHSNIHALLPKGEELWIGTFERGLDVMDIKTGKIIKHYEKGGKHPIPGNFILSFYETRNGELLIGTSVGMFVYDESGDSFRPHKAFPDNEFYTSILEDSDNRLWVGSFGDGLYRYDPRSEEKRRYTHENTLDKSTGINDINGIFEDSGRRVWITTEDGLYRYNRQTDDFKRYSVKHGFPSNVFYAILEDEKNLLWISTSQGLTQFDPIDETVKTYTKAHGLLSDQFNYMSAYKGPDGRFYFGSIGGMVSFEPANIESSKAYIPPLYITDLSVNNPGPKADDGLPRISSILERPEAVLEPDESSFSVSFATLGYTASEVTEYWYKLKDRNEDWVYLKNTPQVNFTDLPPGSYSLDVKSKDINGTLSRLDAPFKIELRPTFWRSDLAYTLYGLAILLLAYLIFNYFRIRAKAKNYRLISELNKRRDEEVFEAKIEFFTNVSHEIRTPLTLIKTPLEKLLQRGGTDTELTENLSIMDKNTNRLLTLTNQLLDFRRAEIEPVRPSFVRTNISQLIRDTYRRFSQSLAENTMTSTLQLDEDDIFALVDEEALEKILSNLLSNALKYGKNKIFIRLSKTPDHFEVRTVNDGNIVPPHLAEKIFEPFFRSVDEEGLKQSGSGLGLSLARSLAELHNGSLYLDTTKKETNTFVLRMPVHQESEIDSCKKETLDVSLDELPAVTKAIPLNSKSVILLVEDHLEMLDFVAKDLSKEYTVLRAMNAAQALETVKLEQVNLIVSDVMMPGMDGFEFCAKIKSEIETSHIPLILLTVKTAMNAKLTGLENGADAFIEKPFSMAHLKAQIANLIENRQKTIEHYSTSPFVHIRSMAHTKTDETFIHKLDTIIRENLSNQELNVDVLAERMHMSRSTFYRKIKDLSNLNPNELLNIARLKKAAELLTTGHYKIYQIAEMVGYKSQSSFTRSFQKQFNMSPSEYVKEMTH